MRWTRVLLLSIGVILLFTRRAFAYSDPGSVSILLQLLIATVAGIAIALRRRLSDLWRWAVLRLRAKDSSGQ